MQDTGQLAQAKLKQSRVDGIQRHQLSRMSLVPSYGLLHGPFLYTYGAKVVVLHGSQLPHSDKWYVTTAHVSYTLVDAGYCML